MKKEEFEEYKKYCKKEEKTVIVDGIMVILKYHNSQMRCRCINKVCESRENVKFTAYFNESSAADIIHVFKIKNMNDE